MFGIIFLDFGNCWSFVILYLDGNVFIGEILEELVNLENLSELVFIENLFEGEIFFVFVVLLNLIGFDFGENWFIGYVLLVIYENVNLVWFVVNDNNFIGDIIVGMIVFWIWYFFVRVFGIIMMVFVIVFNCIDSIFF